MELLELSQQQEDLLGCERREADERPGQVNGGGGVWALLQAAPEGGVGEEPAEGVGELRGAGEANRDPVGVALQAVVDDSQHLLVVVLAGGAVRLPCELSHL